MEVIVVDMHFGSGSHKKKDVKGEKAKQSKCPSPNEWVKKM